MIIYIIILFIIIIIIYTCNVNSLGVGGDVNIFFVGSNVGVGVGLCVADTYVNVYAKQTSNRNKNIIFWNLYIYINKSYENIYQSLFFFKQIYLR